MANLTLSYPFWFLGLVVLTGLIYAAGLYVWNRKQHFGPLLTALLFFLRFTIVSFLCFLLLSPYVKTRKKYTEKPVVILGIDNSMSVVSGQDSAYYHGRFIENLNELRPELEKSYRVETVLFGEGISREALPDFTGEFSNYAALTNYVKEAYSGQNVGALVIAGDGISNRGIDPAFAASGLGYPVYTVAMGDTTRGRDLFISDVRYNSIVYQGDDFPVEVSLTANNLTGTEAEIVLNGFGRQLASRRFNITDGAYATSFLFRLNADQEGKYRIRITLETEASELNKMNNTRDIFIDVLKSRQKLLILANSPHPDIAAIRNSLDQSGNYDIEIQYPGNYSSIKGSYDLIILHQLPSYNQAFQGILDQLGRDNNTPLLFVLGKQSSFSLFNRYFDGLDLRANNRNMEEAEFIFNPRFTAFSFDNDLAGQLGTLPPLIVPFGNYRTSPDAEVLAFQRLNRIETDIPLIMFYTKDDNRLGLVSGEGLWLWRIHNHLQYGNTAAFDRLLGKTLQYLMVRKDKRNFRVITAGEYNSSDPVLIRAELYNPSYEPVNTSDVNFRLSNEQGEQFNFLFSADGESYALDLDRLPVGVYKYLATTQLGKDSFSENGEFIVTSSSLEIGNLDADHGLLFRLAADNNGEMLYPEELLTLPERLASRNDLKSKIYFEEHYAGLHDMVWVIGLILLLLTMEWVLRKYFGSY